MKILKYHDPRTGRTVYVNVDQIAAISAGIGAVGTAKIDVSGFPFALTAPYTPEYLVEELIEGEML